MRSRPPGAPLAAALATALAAAWPGAAARATSPIVFTDVTEASGLTWSVDQPKVQSGVGIALLDADGDGLDDLLVGGGVGGPFGLWRNLGGLVFEPVPSEESGLGFYGTDIRGLGAADCDNDGDVDVFLASWANEPSVFLRNDGGTFVDATAASGLVVDGIASTAAWGDYDADGLVDLYVSRYYNRQNLLFRNLGGCTFEDVTAAAGMLDPNGGKAAQSFQSIWWDADRDGDLDLYENNDRCYGGFDPNFLWLNQGDGTFVESGAAYGLDLCLDAMGMALGDADQDGFMDVFMTNIQFGHHFYRGGCGGWEDISLSAGTACFQWGWSIVFEDLDHDARPDLYIAHEIIGGKDNTNRVFWNQGDLTFLDVSGDAYQGTEGNSFVVVSGDLDLDGDLDLVVGDMGYDGHFRVLRNDSAVGPWLRVALEGTTSNREGLGAWVHVLAGGKWQRQVRHESSVIGGRADPVLHFGLGDAAVVDEVIVYWPSGATQVVGPVPLDTVLELVEPAPGASDPAPPPWGEICDDGIDNDCNGVVDDLPGLGEPCTVGVGACAVEAAAACGPDLRSTVCPAEPLPPGAEVCNGLDDDCDGETDEGFDLGAPCTVGLGACAASGVLACAGGGGGPVCAAALGAPAPEVPDGIDNDCDGETDEAEEPDAGGADAGADGGGDGPDAGGDAEDDAGPVEDAAWLVADAAGPVEDAAGPLEDADEAEDAGSDAPEDTGPSVEDTGPSVEDTGPSVEDTGPAGEDTGPAGEDTGTAPGDTGPAGEDTGPAPGDTGPTGEDTGTAPGDTGPTAEDTGPASGDTAATAEDTGAASGDTAVAAEDTGLASGDTGSSPAEGDASPEAADGGAGGGGCRGGHGASGLLLWLAALVAVGRRRGRAA